MAFFNKLVTDFHIIPEHFQVQSRSHCESKFLKVFEIFFLRMQKIFNVWWTFWGGHMAFITKIKIISKFAHQTTKDEERHDDFADDSLGCDITVSYRRHGNDQKVDACPIRYWICIDEVVPWIPWIFNLLNIITIQTSKWDCNDKPVQLVTEFDERVCQEGACQDHFRSMDSPFYMITTEWLYKFDLSSLLFGERYHPFPPCLPFSFYIVSLGPLHCIFHEVTNRGIFMKQEARKELININEQGRENVKPYMQLY